MECYIEEDAALLCVTSDEREDIGDRIECVVYLCITLPIFVQIWGFPVTNPVHLHL